MTGLLSSQSVVYLLYLLPIGLPFPHSNRLLLMFSLLYAWSELSISRKGRRTSTQSHLSWVSLYNLLVNRAWRRSSGKAERREKSEHPVAQTLYAKNILLCGVVKHKEASQSCGGKGRGKGMDKEKETYLSDQVVQDWQTGRRIDNFKNF